MANKIVFEFTKEQFRNLLDIVYAGNYLLTYANETEEEKYNKIESMIFSRAKEIGKEEYSEYTEEYGGWLPTQAFEEQGIQERINNYDNASFWDELVHRLALKDVAENLNTENPDILIEALLDRTDEYHDFFEKNDLSTVRIKGMKPMSKNTETFRSMNIGEVDMDSFEYDDEDNDDDCDCNCKHDDDCDCCHEHH